MRKRPSSYPLLRHPRGASLRANPGIQEVTALENHLWIPAKLDAETGMTEVFYFVTGSKSREAQV